MKIEMIQTAIGPDGNCFEASKRYAVGEDIDAEKAKAFVKAKAAKIVDIAPGKEPVIETTSVSTAPENAATTTTPPEGNPAGEGEGDEG